MSKLGSKASDYLSVIQKCFRRQLRNPRNLLALPDSKRHSRVQHRKVTCRKETVSPPPFKAVRPRLCLPGRGWRRDADPFLPPGQARRASGRGQRCRCSLGLGVWVCRAKDATMSQAVAWVPSSPGAPPPQSPSIGAAAPALHPRPPQTVQGHQAPRHSLAPEGPRTHPALQANGRIPWARVRPASLSPGRRPPRKPLVFV